jgi:hypothetical protein
MATEAELSARMERAQVSRICDLIDEPDACIVGTVTAKRALFSPGRGAACVAYHFRDTMGHDEHRAVPFVIEDDSGYALIEPRDAILQLFVHEGSGLHRSIVGARYLRNHGVPGSYRERSIEIGQRLYVIGSCTRELDARMDHKLLYRDQPGSHLRFGHRRDVPLVLADRILASG